MILQAEKNNKKSLDSKGVSGGTGRHGLMLWKALGSTWAAKYESWVAENGQNEGTRGKRITKYTTQA